MPSEVGHDGGLHGVLLLLAPDERPPTAPARLGPAHLDLGGVQPQFDVFGLGVGEHVLHGAQTYPWTIRDRVSALGNSVRIWPTARVTVERSTPNSRPSTACGRS